MFDVLFLFPRDGDLTAVDEFLTQRLIPQLTSAAGLRSVRVSQDTIMSAGGPPPYGRLLEASFDTLADVMAVVEESKRRPAEREQLANLGPLVLLYEGTERSPRRIEPTHPTRRKPRRLNTHPRGGANDRQIVRRRRRAGNRHECESDLSVSPSPSAAHPGSDAPYGRYTP